MNFWRDFNIKALFCGPFFYFWQGMVRRGGFSSDLGVLMLAGSGFAMAKRKFRYSRDYVIAAVFVLRVAGKRRLCRLSDPKQQL